MITGPKWTRPPELPRLEANQVHIWRGSVPQNPNPRLTAPLSEEENQRAACFVRQQDRHRSLFSQGMLRLVLAAYLPVEPQHLTFARNAYGKPRLRQAAGKSGIHFNMAHSGELVLIAVTGPAAVGIDVELKRDLRDGKQLVAQNFSPEEQDYIFGSPVHEFHDRFFRCWTLKEAYIKGVGMGLSHPLPTFSVINPDTGTPSAGWMVPQEGANSRWFQLPFPAGPGYHAALVVENMQPGPVFYDFAGY